MIYYMEQNSEEWDDIRRSKLTASEAGQWLLAEPKFTLTAQEVKDWLTYNQVEHKKSATKGALMGLLPASVIESNQGYLKGETEARRGAMCKMIGGELSPITQSFMGNRFTDFGNAFEDDAIKEFELRTGYTIKKVGFVTLDSFDHFGCSPDGLVYDQNGKFLGPLETKCKPEKHVETVIGQRIPDDHALQVDFQIAVCGAECGFFFAYSPDMTPLLIRKPRDGVTIRVERALSSFNKEYEEFRAINLPKLKTL